jgi:hypothetical protein
MILFLKIFYVGEKSPQKHNKRVGNVGHRYLVGDKLAMANKSRSKFFVGK